MSKRRLIAFFLVTLLGCRADTDARAVGDDGPQCIYSVQKIEGPITFDRREAELISRGATDVGGEIVKNEPSEIEFRADCGLDRFAFSFADMPIAIFEREGR